MAFYLIGILVIALVSANCGFFVAAILGVAKVSDSELQCFAIITAVEMFAAKYAEASLQHDQFVSVECEDLLQLRRKCEEITGNHCEEVAI